MSRRTSSQRSSNSTNKVERQPSKARPEVQKPEPKRKSEQEGRADSGKWQKKAYQLESTYTRGDVTEKKDHDNDGEDDDQHLGYWRDESKSNLSRSRHYGRTCDWQTGTYAWSAGAWIANALGSQPIANVINLDEADMTLTAILLVILFVLSAIAAMSSRKHYKIVRRDADDYSDMPELVPNIVEDEEGNMKEQYAPVV